MNLEQRIKALMEANQDSEALLSEESIEDLEEGKETIKTKGGTTITDEDDGDSKDADSAEDDSDDSEEQDDHSEPDGDEDGEDTDGDGDGKTDFSKDQGNKNKVEVKEGNDPFGKLVSNGGDSAADAGKTSKLKVGLGRKEGAAGKLPGPPSSGATDDNGDNARLKTGLGKKETTGKVKNAGPSDGSGANPDSARNNAGTELQKGADKNPVGVKEHMDALFNGEELSEEFQTKAATIFEAAVEQVAQARLDALQEEYAQEIVKLQESQEEQLNEAVEEIKSELVENIDGFLNYVVEQWVSDNQVELESGIKVEMVSGFIDGLKTLFKENYVDIPEDKLDIIEEQSAEINELSGTVNALAEENQLIQNELVALKSELVFEAVSDDLTVQQAEKFFELIENVEFTTEEEYAEKLETLRENYFPNGITSAKALTEETTIIHSDESMSKYVEAIGKNVRFNS